MKLKILSTNTSEKKGTIKKPQQFIELSSKGIIGDAHSGIWHRQVSLLGIESINKFSIETKRDIRFGEFAENLTTEGLPLFEMRPFDRLVNENIELEITQIGKKCHGDNCSVFKEVGNCVMPKEGIFARVIMGGILKNGDELEYIPRIFKVMVITLSDRASRGEYEDVSGPLLAKLTKGFFNANKRESLIDTIIIPDVEEKLSELIKEAKDENYDIVLTTGGTGIGFRDITPDVVEKFLDKEIPGIMEYIRTKYGAEKPNAMLSRGIAGVAGSTLIFTLPGNPRAINEYCSEIFRILDHAFLMLHGIDGH